MTQKEWEARLGRMRKAAAIWSARASGDDSGPPKVEAGSSLAGDDRLFPSHPVSSVAWHGLLTAVEHLEFALDSMAKTQTAYPAAYFTVLRAGLLGAAQAVWVLEPAQRRERQMRGLEAAMTNYDEQRKMLNSLTAADAEQQRDLDQAVARMKDRLNDVAAAAVQIGCEPAKASKIKLVATDVIKEAASKALSMTGGREAEYAMHLWRMGSGHAHGHAYTRYLQIDTESLIQEADGRLWGRTTATTENLGLAASAVVIMTKEGFELYDRRRSNFLQ
ncbi:hypothetical protein [Streptomyces microflavus]|uniref:hypothetical protein n=1 Tax=Streptomyces microflavus TaxID=1919 RepID=UPI0033D75C85